MTGHVRCPRCHAVLTFYTTVHGLCVAACDRCQTATPVERRPAPELARLHGGRHGLQGARGAQQPLVPLVPLPLLLLEPRDLPPTVEA
jgi:hypothetical protein